MNPLTPEEQKEKNEHEIVLANAGKQVLSNIAFQTAMLERKTQIFNLFTSTGFAQAEVREDAYKTMVNLIALEDYFEKALTTGKMAEISLASNEINEQEK